MSFNLLVCSDIFGVSDDLIDFCEQISSSERDYLILDPYDGCPQNFVDESSAYAAFTEAGGIDAYVRCINDAISELNSNSIIIGFSAGGAAAWRSLSLNPSAQVAQLVAFYPGQIRHYLDDCPNCQSRIIMPNSEPHFDVRQIEKILSTMSAVKTNITPYMHGFMNPLSKGYSEEAYQYYFNKLKSGSLFCES